MDREKARQVIKERWREIMPALGISYAKERVNGTDSYICPFCGHGTHGDGLAVNPRSIDGNGLHCFGCSFTGDVIDIIQQMDGCNYGEAMNKAADILGVTLDKYAPTRATAAEDFKPEPRATAQAATRPEARPAAAAEPEQDFTAYYQACQQRLSDPSAAAYLTGRGISIDTAEKYGIGFDPDADPAGNPGNSKHYSAHPCPRIIIPTCKSHYVGRSIDPNTESRYKKMNPKNGTPAVFNLGAIYADEDAVFVVEGAFDALSLLEVGAAAVALNSTSNADKLIKQLEKRPTKSTLIICLDNDDAGKKASCILQDGCRRLNVSYITANVSGNHKDPNEALTADKAAFETAVNRAKLKTAAKPDNVSSYIDLLMGGEIDRFKEAKDRKTGFANLDEKSGGLYSGLYCIAAISSLGKTTFTHQVADQLAAAGEEVLFFSLEQSKLELITKSMARITAQEDINTAVTSLSIRRGNLPDNVIRASERYQKMVGDRMSIIEGNFNCDISFIGEYVRRFISKTGKKPVVVIDYLQILQPGENSKLQKREAIDCAVTELKRISRENELTVFIISSVNRANYLSPIDFESLKESGGIEYTCDVIWGLQLQVLNDEIFDSDKKIKEKRAKVKEAKAANPRKIELVCLKNRYGIANFSTYFDYYPSYDLYVEGEPQYGSDEIKLHKSTIKGYKKGGV